ncbi:MAG: hypothetical protein K1X67_11105 [Fimbriimonadaceae bacterium]|nr:hypothetical protein [Fimbriimonadaceae bacterium]
MNFKHLVPVILGPALLALSLHPWEDGGILRTRTAGVPPASGKQTPTATEPAGRQRNEEADLFIAGDFSGYLSPCGCFKPMIGGIRRLATAIKTHDKSGKAVFIANGALVKTNGRQDEIKAETLAEALKSMNVAAVGLTADDVQLGPGNVASLARLSGNKLVSGSLAQSDLPIALEKGPFLFGSASMRAGVIAERLSTQPVPPEKVAESLVEEAKQADKVPVLLFDGNEEAARTIAAKTPGLKLLIFRASSRPAEKIEKVDECVLISPSERGKFLVKLTWTGREFQTPTVIELGPEHKDDVVATRLFKNYVERVKGENLLDRVPREASAPFAGSQACASCHSDAYEVWKNSAHAHALATLEKEGQDRDPDCTGCHVVGLTSKGGFISRKETPKLTDVGCESCHGPGAEHVEKPTEMPMKKVGRFSCLKCHVPDHSPGFSFQAAWDKIKH